MNYKIICHLMPWELDYALLSFTQLKKSKYYLDKEDKVYIDVSLNLSEYIINWEDSKIPKEFFIDKFKTLQPLLKDYICSFKIYDGKELYGALNLHLEATKPNIDHYMVLNPDMYFSENLLYYLIESSKQIKNEYFTITPQIPKLWDSTWDVISHENYDDIPYQDWDKLDVYNVRHFMKYSLEDINLVPVNTHKWAGWMDLYNKKTWENFYIHHKEWKGYGPCDWYSMLLSQHAKSQGVDFQQYILKNQLTCEYAVGPLKKGYSVYYKDMLSLNQIPNQRDEFESRMQEYLHKGVEMLKEKNII